MKGFFKLRRQAKRRWRQVRYPIGSDETRRALDQVLETKVNILFMHSSLSALGHFTSGPTDILKAVADRAETLGLPTHSYSYPTLKGEHGPVFDAASTPSNNGLLSEIFRRQSGVVRSVQSTHSLAMRGPLAESLTAGHYINDTPCGAGTPYARMIEKGASALMWGVTFHSYTFFHTAEDAAGSAFAYESKYYDRLRVVNEQGHIQEHLTRRQTRDPRRFAECGQLMERVGLVRRVPLGAGALLVVPDCTKAHDFLVERLRRTPDFLFANCTAPLQ